MHSQSITYLLHVEHLLPKSEWDAGGGCVDDVVVFFPAVLLDMLVVWIVKVLAVGLCKEGSDGRVVVDVVSTHELTPSLDSKVVSSTSPSLLLLQAESKRLSESREAGESGDPVSLRPLLFLLCC